jgi:hypothetical protein
MKIDRLSNPSTLSLVVQKVSHDLLTPLIGSWFCGD